FVLASAATGSAQPGKGTPPGKAESYVSPVSANIPAAPDKPAVIVNGEMISMAEVKAVLEERPYPNTIKADDIKAIRKAVIDMLIDDMLVRQFLAKYADKVTPADLAKEMQNVQDLLKKQNRTVQDQLKESGKTMEQFQKDVASRLQWGGYLRKRMNE